MKGGFSFSLIFLGVILTWSAHGRAAEPDIWKIGWEELIGKPETLPIGQTIVEEKTSDVAASITEENLASSIESRRKALVNRRLDGAIISISGFVVSLERNSDDALVDFLLVPYYGACIHVPPPPPNQMIYVKLNQPHEQLRSMDHISVAGMLLVRGNDEKNAAYHLTNASVDSPDGFGPVNFLVAGLITLTGSLSIGLGLLVSSVLGRERSLFICLSLSFTAGVMSLLGLSAIVILFSWRNLIFFMAGVICLAMIERFTHPPASSVKTVCYTSHNDKSLVWAVSIHGLPESFAIFSTSLVKPGLGIALALTMAAHTIPLGFSFTSLKPSVRLRYALWAGFNPAVGAVLVFLLLKPLLVDIDWTRVLAFVGGMMLYIACKNQLPSARLHGSARLIVFGYCAGIIVMFLISTFLPLGNL